MRVFILICALFPRALVAFNPAYRPRSATAFSTKLRAVEPPIDVTPEEPESDEPVVPPEDSFVVKESVAKEDVATKEKPKNEEAPKKEEEPKKEESKPAAAPEITPVETSIEIPKEIKDAFENNDGQELLFEFLGTAGTIAIDVLKGLRWTAANVLTASLPQEERLEMISRIEPGLGSANDIIVSTQGSSVNENIAAADAAESRRLEKWEEEKVQITKKAEEAANERIAAELAIQKQRMQKEQEEKTAKLEKERLEAEQTALGEMIAQANEQAKAEADKEKLNKLEQALRKKEKEASEDQDNLWKLSDELHSIKDQQKSKDEELKAIKKALSEKEAQLKSIKESAPVPEKQSQATPSLGDVELRRYSPAEYKALSAEDKEKLRELREQNPKWMDNVDEPETFDYNPILGPVVADLGYKRLHFVSAGKLGTIPIWEKQRIYRNERTKSMAKDKMKALKLGFPGVICLHEEKDGKLCIIDGQHRIGMMAQLRDTLKKQQEQSGGSADADISAVDFERVLVEVYPDESNLKDHKQDLFLEINKAEPVKLIDMPGVAKASERNVITEAVEKLRDNYPKMFSPSQMCREPNLNVDNMRNALFTAKVMSRHKLTTSKKLYDWIMDRNDKLEAKFAGNKDGQLRPRAWKKASENGLYLGLVRTWFYDV